MKWIIFSILTFLLLMVGLTHAQVSQQLDELQYYYNTDPGVGVAGNGGLIPLSNNAVLDQTFAFPIPSGLEGLQNLYVRIKDNQGRWSLAERRSFYISDIVSGTKHINAYQYYFNTDPGVGEAGNGQVVSVSSTSDFDNTVAINIPSLLGEGLHNLYIRIRDESDNWSLAERRSFYISDIVSGTKQIDAYQYYFDTDPGVGEVGNGQVVSVSSTSDFDNTVALNIPSTLDLGIHNLYIRVRDESGNWSLVERRTFYISEIVTGVKNIVALEYFFDNDPGVGNGLPYPVSPATDTIDQLVELSVPCLSAGEHYFYLRAQDENGNWSIVERDTLTSTGDIIASNISPAGPVSICENESVVLSTTEAEGVNYQWLKNDVEITGETNASITVLTAGDYRLEMDCGGLPVSSNTVTVSVQPLVTFYADTDGDGYGDILNTISECTAPPGYVSDNTDCDDTDANIHPGAAEVCNGVDDDCDSNIDEGVQNTYYADGDGDGYGDPNIGVLACTAPSGYVSDHTDCDDTNAAIHPGATEVCNGVDDNCDGQIDEGVQNTYYADTDGDGYGDPNSSILDCSVPAGFVSDNTDCDDTDPAIHPGASEVCNGLDDNCDGQVDEGFDYSTAPNSITSSEGDILCFGDTTYLSVNGGILGSSAEWHWYEGGCGNGTSIGMGNSIMIIPNTGIHNYYVRAEGICNSTSCVSIQITVNEAPLFTSCPANMSTTNATGECRQSVSYSVNASGVPAPEYSYEFSGATVNGGNGTGSGLDFNVGTTLVTILAINSCDTAFCSFSVTVNDTENPQFSDCPADIVIYAAPGEVNYPEISWQEPQASDNCAVDQVTSTHSPGDIFEFGTTNVQYTATDASGNSKTCSFNVTVNPPEVLEDLNLSIFANDILFSDPNPSPGDPLTVTANVHNTSDVDAPPFDCQFINELTGATQTVNISGLGAHQTHAIEWQMTAPSTPEYVPIKVELDIPLPDGNLTETNELDNQAIRAFIAGDLTFPGEIVVNSTPSPSPTTAGSKITICGNAYYDNFAIPLSDTSVAGASVKLSIVETGQTFYTHTNNNGDYCLSFYSVHTPGVYNYTVEVTDFTLTGSTSNTFELTTATTTCPLDLSIRMELNGSFIGSRPPYNLLVGELIDAEIQILNNCTATNDPTTVSIYTPDGYSDSKPIPALSSGEVYTVTFSNIPFNTPGATYVSATVDPPPPAGGAIAEDNEENNTKSIPIMVHEALPDIVPKGVESSKYYCENTSVKINVANQGGVATGSFLSDVKIFDPNGTQVHSSSESIPDISPLGQYTLEIPFTPSTTGVYSVEVDCDPALDVLELSEVNNSLQKEMNFLDCEADLIVWGCGPLDVKPADPVENTAITVSATIENQGKEDALAPFNVAFDVGGTLYTETVNTDLLAGDHLVITTNVTAPLESSSNKNFNVTVDPGDQDVPESNESNNSSGGSLCWDFELTNLRCDNKSAMPLQQSICNTLQLGTAIFNYGLYEASALDIQFEIQEPGSSTWTMVETKTRYMNNTCNCPHSFELESNYTFPTTGTYLLRITADPDGDYAECDETNNVLNLSVQVVENADYAVYSQYIAPSKLNPDINESISFNMSYENNGCDGFNPIELRVEVDEIFLDQITADGIAAGAFNSYAIPNTWSSGVPGLHIVREFIDYNDAVAEGNELNNEATRSIIVGPATDLAVVAVSTSDPSPSTGDNIGLTGSIHNFGGGGGAGGFGGAGGGSLRFSFQSGDGDPVLISEQQVSVEENQTLDFSTNWTVTDPSALIIAEVVDVDPTDYDLSNNTGQVQINSFNIALNKTDVPCTGLDSGSVEVAVLGGKEPYQYAWSNGLGDKIIDVPAGTYEVTVTDANGLSETDQITVENIEDPTVWYLDDDGDGFGNIDSALLACEQPANYVSDSLDCNDTDSLINPLAQEICDSLDNDCDGLIDDADPSIVDQLTWYIDVDGDGYGDANVSILSCDSPSGYVLDNTDCYDLDTLINPGIQEVCNGIDDDCDGLIDDADPSIIGQSTWYLDNDADGYGNPDSSIKSCDPPVGYVGVGTDCDDNNANTYPDAIEILDGLDNDCDGQIDEGLSEMSIDAGNCSIVYLGFGPEECVDLIVTITDGIPPYSISWNTGETTDTINACPDTTQSYTVTVTDSTGYTVSDEVTVQVIDVQCGGNNNKVSICHYPPGNNNNPQNICVSENAVLDHLVNHGDYLGACNASDPCGNGIYPQPLIVEKEIEEIKEGSINTYSLDGQGGAENGLKVYPNPTRSEVHVCCINQMHKIEIYSLVGSKERSIEGNSKCMDIDLIELPSGIYIIQVKDEQDNIYKKRMIIVE